LREIELAELEEQAAALSVGPAHRDPEPVELVFVPGERYRLVEIDATPLAPGFVFGVEGIEHSVARVGSSPLPQDGRRCAYLVRGRGEVAASDGSS
jgi:hypothetical protein